MIYIYHFYFYDLGSVLQPLQAVLNSKPCAIRVLYTAADRLHLDHVDLHFSYEVVALHACVPH